MAENKTSMGSQGPTAAEPSTSTTGLEAGAGASETQYDQAVLSNLAILHSAGLSLGLAGQQLLHWRDSTDLREHSSLFQVPYCSICAPHSMHQQLEGMADHLLYTTSCCTGHSRMASVTLLFSSTACYEQVTCQHPVPVAYATALQTQLPAPTILVMTATSACAGTAGGGAAHADRLPAASGCRTGHVSPPAAACQSAGQSPHLSHATEGPCRCCLKDTLSPSLQLHQLCTAFSS